MPSHIHTSHESVAGGFTETASDYEGAVRFNIEGAQRLVLSIPPGRYDRVLDVGCGTGWAAQAVIDRFRPGRITGVDPAQGMLDLFQEKLGGIEGVEITLAQADVENMPVAEGSFDLVVCSMAYHWFPRKWEAAKAMARALKPGGVLAILMSGRGGEQAYRDVISNIEPINYRWVGAFDGNLRSVPEMEDYLVQAGLEPVDIWMETRVRHTSVEAYMERMRVVAGHVIGDQSEAEVAEYVAKIEAELRARSAPRGWRYEFAKLFAIARKPS
jgi:ubiquinone/menaquinone biosynthesis C-methylase UbiE